MIADEKRNFPDMLNKLVVLKTGLLFKKGLVDIDSKPLDVDNYFKLAKKDLDPAEVVALYGDKEHPARTHSNPLVNYKLVF